MKRFIYILSVLITSVLATYSAFAKGEVGELFKKNCAACHGEGGAGGMGPQLLGTKLSREEFTRVVRVGKGMMPAVESNEVDDRSLDVIYQMFAGAEAGTAAGTGGFTAFAGRLLSKKNVLRIGWGSVVIMLIGLAFVVYSKYLNWSGFKFGRKYYRRLGAMRIATIFLRTLIFDTFSVSSVWKKDKWRWLVHGLLLYGFFGLIAADILISIFNPERTMMPFFSPLKILANISGISLLAGLAVVIYRILTDPYEDNKETFAGDIIFVAIIASVVITGFGLEATRYMGLVQYTQGFYFCHILLIVALFISAPFTRFVHIVSTFFLVLATRLSEASADLGVTLGFREEPAPGRHHKTERIARDVVSKLRPEAGAEKVEIRYFP